MNTETVHKMCKHCKCITRKALTTKKLFVTQIFFLHLNSYHACSLFVQVLSVSTTYLIILFIQLNYCRMKKVISTLLFFVITSIGFTQTTYYWVGGAGPGTFTSSSNWNTSLDGSGTSRATAAADDILIFDGANTGGTLPTTGLVNVTTATNNFGQLIIQNNAQVHFSRTSTGSGTVTINGGVGDDFIVDATSTLTMGGPLGNYDVFIVLATGATGKINGTIHLGPLSTTVHPRAYITAPAVNSLIFESGSQIHINDSTATSGFNGSVANSILFKTGSSLYYYAGRSPIGTSSAILSAIQSLIFGKPSESEINEAKLEIAKSLEEIQKSNIEFLEQLLRNLQIMLDAMYENFILYSLVAGSVAAIGLTGIILMFRRKELGFHLYIIYCFLYVAQNYLLVSPSNVPFLLVIGNLLISGLFVFIYSRSISWFRNKA